MKYLKKIDIKNFMVMAVASSFFAFASCSDDDNNGGSGSGGFSTNDPEGTVVVNLSNDESNCINCFNGYVAGLDPQSNLSVKYGINSSNNFVSINGNWIKFACVGKIDGLSSITGRDTANSGYSESCAIIPGYGYIGKCSHLMVYKYAGFNTGYIRIYVDGWIKNTDGEIIGATIKYQDNWIITGDTLRVYAEATTKNVLIEQFTGNNNIYCPAGHKIMNDLIASNPDKVFGINIHTGPYASAYTTDFGSAIYESSSSRVFPSATVNRHRFSDLSMDSGNAIVRRNYLTATNQMLYQSSCANIAANATINRITRELKVNVAVYYTSFVNNSTHKINVALLQDSIWGSQQSNADTYYPDYYNAITGEYCHMHMLRHLVTGQWGDDIYPVVGRVIRKTYNYTIPAQISNENVALDHLKILVFLAEGRNEIITVCNAPITIR